MEQKSMSDELENFKSKYHAHVQEGTRRYAVPKRMSIDPLSTDKDMSWDLDFEYESSVQIDMSKRDFETLIGMEAYFESQLRDRDWENFSGYAKSIVDKYEREVRIRNNNPAAKIAYAKYQTVLRMVDSYYD
jgi:hypothetical protein